MDAHPRDSDAGMLQESIMASSDAAQDDEFVALLKKLDLYKYFPCQLTRHDVLEMVDEEMDDKKIDKPEDLCRIFMQRLLYCNYKARDLEIDKKEKVVSDLGQDKHLASPGSGTTASVLSQLFGPTDTKSELDVLIQCTGSIEAQRNDIHPLDVVVAVFLCSDPILKQDIARLLWECKLAIPFITSIHIHDTPTVHMWPLKSITATWSRTKDGPIEEDNIVCPPFLTIGFIRFHSDSVKKSNIINILMSDTEKVHPIFYHRNSVGSIKRRVVSNGMVEISWYLPNGSEDNMCHEPVTIINLRGNAAKYPQQLNILSGMVSICCIICSASDIMLEDNRRILESIQKMNKLVIIITYDDKKTRGMGVMTCDNLIILNTQSLTHSELKKEVKSILSEQTRNKLIKRTSIEKFSWVGIQVDQNGKDINDGLYHAEMILKNLLKEEMECRKDKLLPLHGDLWRNWVETENEIQRLTKIPKLQDIAEYRYQKEMKKVNIRQEQAKILKNGVSEAIHHFVKSLNIREKVTRMVCVRWLNIELEKLSRKQLKYFLEKEESIQAQMKSVRNINQGEFDRLNKELEQMQDMKNKSHLGIEHLFRELGQIYEVTRTQKPGERYDMGYDLPQLAARYLLDGNSFEIFDGDAGSIPITWISAVFESLSKLVTKLSDGRDPKCTVLSVYGMQSSGKSTLLNTMFGCHFAVSAGRCTRGVHIQLLKMNNDKTDSRVVDYILLVDTEGVRSQEMIEDTTRRRDNEITTFIVGLGQKTLINLMGENTSYLTEVLPIAVRAILRMEDVGLHPSCAIVYQNVDSQSRDAISSQNRKLHEVLDTQTRSACLMEKKEEKRFQDVIQFDVEKDVHYIPSLWEGEKPMAPVSQGYSKSTLKLKNSFREFCKQSTCQNLSLYSLHVNSLWKAITKDDFVYFFRNMLETEAREYLDKFWCDSVWNLRMEASKCESILYIDIMNCPDVGKLEEICRRSQIKMSKDITSSHGSMNTRMEHFFEQAPKKYTNYMCQWEASSIDGLSRIKDDLIRELEQEVANLQLRKSKVFLVEGKVKELKERIKEEVVAFIRTVESNMASREDMMNLFEKKWKGWREEVKSLCVVHEQKSNIARKAVDILMEKFSSHKGQVREKWETISPGERREVQIQPSYLLKGKTDVTDDILTDVRNIVDKTIYDVEKQLNELTRKPSPYKHGSLEQIVQTTSRIENKLEALGVKMTKDFEIDLAITVVSFAIDALSKNEKKFLDFFDPVSLLEKEKKNFMVLFEINYEKTTNAISFVRRVFEVLTNIIQFEIIQNIPQEVAHDMRCRVYTGVLNNKKSLLRSILCRMAEDEIFSQFMGYIRNPTKTIEEELGRYVDKYSSADGTNPSKLHSLLDRLILRRVEDLIIYAEETEKQMRAKGGHTIGHDQTKDIKLQHWITTFARIASTTFMVNEIRSLSDVFGEVTVDLKYFSNELLKQLKNSTPQFDNLVHLSSPEYKEMKMGVVHMLRRLVVGCTDACPFCGEICISVQENHVDQPNHRDRCEKHETPFHRPQGCNGYKTEDSRVLTMASCPKLVASEFEFTPSRTSEEWFPYKKFDTIYTSWKITGDPSPIDFTFWQWFMITYIKDLEKEHKGKAPRFPDVWKTFTKEVEIEKLKEDMAT